MTELKSFTNDREIPKPAVRITGWGVATPLGMSARQTWESVIKGEFIENHAMVPLARAGGSSRVSQLALRVAREAIDAARWSGDEVADDRTALLIGTSKGPIEEWLRGAPSARPAAPHVILGDSEGSAQAVESAGSFGVPQYEMRHRSPAVGLHTIASDLAVELRLGHGPRLTLSAACASGLHALIRAGMLLQSGEARRALVIAVESSVHPLFVGSFQRLGVLPKPGIGCRPFDRHRDGFLISEAAAAVCLEADDSGCGAGFQPAPRMQAESPHHNLCIENFAIGGAAGHLTAGDPDGALMRRLLQRVIAGRPIDLVHAHATGTKLNDPIELAAIEAALPPARWEDQPSLYSHKGSLGHSLGAAGLVAVVLNCLMHEAGCVLPNVRTMDPLPTNRVRLLGDAVARPIRRSIAAASGFGGPTAVVSLRSF